MSSLNTWPMTMRNRAIISGQSGGSPKMESIKEEHNQWYSLIKVTKNTSKT